MIFYNDGVYRLQKVLNSTSPVGHRCVFARILSAGAAGSFTFGTPGKVLNLTTNRTAWCLQFGEFTKGNKNVLFQYLAT